MSKLLLFTFTVLLSFAPLMKVQAKATLGIDYIRSLPKARQKKVISKIIQVIIQLEDIQNKRLGNKKTVELKRKVYKLLSILMSSAHAGDGFTPKVGSNRCLYGGWLSYMFKNHCMHPLMIKTYYKNYYGEDGNASKGTATQKKNIKAIFEEVYKKDDANTRIRDIKPNPGALMDAYIDAGKDVTDSTCPKNSRKIYCNPLLFGKVNFCAGAGAGKASYNSSLECFKKSKEQDIDITTILSNSLSCDHAGPFNELVQHIFDLCACAPPADKTTAKGDTFDYYKTKMFSHRTCLALNAQLSELVDSGNIDNAVESETIMCNGEVTKDSDGLKSHKAFSSEIRHHLKNINTTNLLKGNLTLEDFHKSQRKIDLGIDLENSLDKNLEDLEKSHKKEVKENNENFVCSQANLNPVDPIDPNQKKCDDDFKGSKWDGKKCTCELPKKEIEDNGVKLCVEVQDPEKKKCDENNIEGSIILPDKSCGCEEPKVKTPIEGQADKFICKVPVKVKCDEKGIEGYITKEDGTCACPDKQKLDEAGKKCVAFTADDEKCEDEDDYIDGYIRNGDVCACPADQELNEVKDKCVEKKDDPDKNTCEDEDGYIDGYIRNDSDVCACPADQELNEAKDKCVEKKDDPDADKSCEDQGDYVTGYEKNSAGVCACKENQEVIDVDGTKACVDKDKKINCDLDEGYPTGSKLNDDGDKCVCPKGTTLTDNKCQNSSNLGGQPHVITPNMIQLPKLKESTYGGRN